MNSKELLLIAERVVVAKDRHWLNAYLCYCGNVFYTRELNVASGSTTSCGCYQLIQKSKHNLSREPEYRTWVSMKSRCYNPTHSSYSRYGGRGIKVCDRWLKFENFYEDMGTKPSPKLTLERIDNEGDYTPENCRWATVEDQSYNKHTTKYYSYKGKEYTSRELKEMLGDESRLFNSRIQRGWTIERIMSTPKLTYRGNHVWTE